MSISAPKGVIATMLLALHALCVAAEAPELPRVQLEHQAMGTAFEVILYGPTPESDPEALAGYAQEAFAGIDALEQEISTWREGSATSRVNRHAAEGPVPVPRSVLRMLLRSKEVYRDTDGVFDVTVGPLLAVWGKYAHDPREPGPDEIAKALANVGLDKVELDESAGTVRFTKEGMCLDFGGIGKGLALDRAAGILRARGVTSALLHGGTSSIVAVGAPPGHAGWEVHLGPFDDRYPQIETVVIRDESLSSSSAYEKPLAGREGKRSHIFDPRTGQPVADVLGASAIAPTGMESDALSTAFFVMGREQTEHYCQTHPSVRAIVVVAEGDAPKAIRISFPAQAEERP